jgi:hypothetical protein
LAKESICWNAKKLENMLRIDARSFGNKKYVRFLPRKIVQERQHDDNTNERKRLRFDSQDFPYTPSDEETMGNNLADLTANMNQNLLKTGKISAETRAYLEEELKQGRRKVKHEVSASASTSNSA